MNSTHLKRINGGCVFLLCYICILVHEQHILEHKDSYKIEEVPNHIELVIYAKTLLAKDRVHKVNEYHLVSCT